MKKQRGKYKSFILKRANIVQNIQAAKILFEKIPECKKEEILVLSELGVDICTKTGKECEMIGMIMENI